MRETSRAVDKKPQGNNNQDQSVYEAMVNLAQDWKVKYPLIDFHGNVGSVDGDPAAAMRYTEGRLAPAGELLMADIDKDTVEMKKNYDEAEMEAVELPGLFPTLLANGSSGIAVGMACSFVPHRVKDIYAAVDKIIENSLIGEDTSIDELIGIVQAPDFPSGGIITNLNDVYRGYKEGKGTVHIRSRYEIVEDNKGTSSIIVTEIPYGVNKAKLIDKMDELRKSGEIPDIKEVRDESNKDGMRIIIEVKKGGNEQFVLNKLMKRSDLATTAPMNHQAIVNGHVQERLTLKDLLESFLEHAISVTKRRSAFLLQKQEKRLIIVQGFLTIASSILEVIEIITNCETDEEVAASLSDAYGLNQAQVDAIQARRLGSLKKLDQRAYEEEADALVADIAHLTAITTDDIVLLEETRQRLNAVAARFEKEERRSEISTEDALQDIEDRDLVPLQDVVIMQTHKGLIKAVRLSDYNSQNRNGKGVSAKTKEDDFVENIITLTSRDDLVFFTNIGKAYVLPAFKIPIMSKTSAGKYIQNYIPLEEGERTIGVFSINRKEDTSDNSLFFTTRRGTCKRLSIDDLPMTRSGAKIITIKENDELIGCCMVAEEDKILLATKDGFAMKTAAKNIRIMGRAAAGVIGIRFKQDDDEVVAAVRANDDDSLLVVAEKGIGKRMNTTDIRLLANNGGKGVTYYKPTERTGSVKGVFLINDEQTIFVITQNGMLIRMPAESISTVGRTAAGVRIVNLSKGDTIASVSAAPKSPEDELEEESDG